MVHIPIIYIHVKVFMHTKRVSARQTGSPEEVVPAESRVATAPSVINSMTNPDAWQWLNRACKKKRCATRGVQRLDGRGRKTKPAPCKFRYKSVPTRTVTADESFEA